MKVRGKKKRRSRRSSLRLSRESVMTLRRSALAAERLVYLLAVKRPLKYLNGRSRIVYIGTTRRGVRRIASSVAQRAEVLFEQRGLKEVDAHVLTYRGKPGVKNMWSKLERAALIMFKFQYGAIPMLNTHGAHYWPEDEFRYFSRRFLLKQIRAFERK